MTKSELRELEEVIASIQSKIHIGELNKEYLEE